MGCSPAGLRNPGQGLNVPPMYTKTQGDTGRWGAHWGARLSLPHSLHPRFGQAPALPLRERSPVTVQSWSPPSSGQPGAWVGP